MLICSSSCSFPYLFSALTFKYPFVVIFCVDLCAEFYSIIPPAPPMGGKVLLYYRYFKDSSYMQLCRKNSGYVTPNYLKNYITTIKHACPFVAHILCDNK